MTLYESISVIGRFFQLTYIENSGIAFGINFRGGPAIFTVLAILATMAVFGYLWKVRNQEVLLKLSLALILGGAVGNLIDRILYGAVADFLDFDFPNISIPPLDMGIFNFQGYQLHRWPVFNLADSCVTIGIILFLYFSFFKTTDSGKTQR